MLAMAAVVALARPADAQPTAAGCAAAAGALQDACQKTADIFDYMVPQLGALAAGGNAIVGEGGNLGKFGRFAIGLKGTAYRVRIPDLRDTAFDPSGAVQSDIGTLRQFAGMPSVDLSVAVFRGFPIELTNVLGVDLLGSLAFLPTFSTDGGRVETSGGAGHAGYGVRVGVLQEASGSPGVAVTYMRRGLPTTDVTVRTSRSDTLRVSRMSLDADSWRLVVAKHFISLGVVAGIGQDRYDASGTGLVTLDPTGMPQSLAEPLALEQKQTRTNAFVSASMSWPFVRVVGEFGSAFGGGGDTYNRFADHAADDPIFYGTLGVRVGF